LALLVQIYLRINRIDQAQKELKSLQRTDDDATITQLATAWVSSALVRQDSWLNFILNIDKGGEYAQEALQIYQQLGERYGTTATLLNGIGVCHFHLKRFADAENSFLQALEKVRKLNG
jgi:coatomer protein complex subunit epsilon